MVFGGAVDRANNAVYFTSGRSTGGALFRMDLGNFSLHVVAGDGHIPFTIDGPGGLTVDDPIDGAPALEYPLAQPRAVAIGPDGNVYFSERIIAGSNAFGMEFCGILKLDVAAQVITRVAGGEPGPQACGFAGDGGNATEALLGQISYMAFDSAGNLFLSDIDNARIRRIDAFTGEIDTVAGGGSQVLDGSAREALQSQLGGPQGLAFDADGNLIFSQGALWRIAASNCGRTRSKAALGMGEIITPLLRCGWVGLTPPQSCPDWPLGGDRLPIGLAFGFGGSAVTIASDGSILTVQGNRIRRVMPAEGRNVITGLDNGEIVQTIAGFEYDVASPVFGGSNGGGERVLQRRSLRHQFDARVSKRRARGARRQHPESGREQSSDSPIRPSSGWRHDRRYDAAGPDAARGHHRRSTGSGRRCGELLVYRDR